MATRHIDDEVHFWEQQVEEILSEMGFPEYKTGHANDMWQAEKECPADIHDRYFYND